MANKNGLCAPEAYAAPNRPYYASSQLRSPTLVSPITLQASAVEGPLAVPAEIYVDGTNTISPSYVGAVNIVPGGNAASATPGAGITVRTAAGPSTIVEIGANAQGPNLLYVAGASGVSQVYDEKYNPAIKGTPVASVSGALPGTWGVGLFSYTPDVSGAYMLQVNLNFTSAQALAKPAAGFIEWTLTTAGGEVQYVSNTLASTVIEAASLITNVNGVAGGIADPVDYSFSDMCVLTAGVPVAFNLFAGVAGAGAWAASLVQARLIKMC